MKQLGLYVSHDLRNGVWSAWRKYLIAAIAFAIVCGSLYSDFAYLCHTPQLTGVSSPTFADYLFYVQQGMPWFKPQDKSFNINVLWLAYSLFLAYIVSFYPFKDLGGFGQQMLLHAQKRNIWWLCKCIWCVVSVTVFYAIMVVVAFVYAFLFGDLSLETTVQIQTMFSKVVAQLTTSQVLLYVVFLPWITSVAISLIQMTISMVFHPLAGMLAVCAILVASIFGNTYFLPGSNLMLCRCSLISGSTIQLIQGTLVAVGMIVLAVVIGLIFFQRKDILNLQY